MSKYTDVARCLKKALPRQPQVASLLNELIEAIASLTPQEIHEGPHEGLVRTILDDFDAPRLSPTERAICQVLVEAPERGGLTASEICDLLLSRFRITKGEDSLWSNELPRLKNLGIIDHERGVGYFLVDRASWAKIGSKLVRGIGHAATDKRE